MSLIWCVVCDDYVREPHEHAPAETEVSPPAPSGCDWQTFGPGGALQTPVTVCVSCGSLRQDVCLMKPPMTLDEAREAIGASAGELAGTARRGGDVTEAAQRLFDAVEELVAAVRAERVEVTEAMVEAAWNQWFDMSVGIPNGVERMRLVLIAALEASK